MNHSPEIQRPNSTIGGGWSSQTSQPSLLQGGSSPADNQRKTYLELYNAAKKGNWEVARNILADDTKLVYADLTNRHETILHVATQANQADFVRKLVRNEMISEADMEMPNVNGNTAFVFAVASGNMQIVEIMERCNSRLGTKRGCGGVTPLHVAALQGRTKMAQHLYRKTSKNSEYKSKDWETLIFCCVNSGIYDIAMKLLDTNSNLALARDEAGETVLHILSRKPLGLEKTQQLELVKKLWNIILESNDKDRIMTEITKPSHVIFNAVEVGSFEFLVHLTSTYPYLIWEADNTYRSIIHIAVLNRHADIFGFIHDIGSIKDILVTYEDKSDGSEKNNLLHMAAKLARKEQLNLVSGAAFQMTLELLWFEEVKKIVPPSFIEKKNKEGLTPHELFTVEHEQLLKKAESWTKKTTNCCMVVSTLISTGVFTATFSIPGGTEDQTGSPHYLVNEKMWFMIFSIFDAIAMISSSTSIFIFFSILISRHEEYDFQYESLPRKLITGMFTLFISIISMMITFSSAFMMYFKNNTHTHSPHYNGLKWVPIFISVLAVIPIPVFAYLLLPLRSDIAKLTKFRRHISQPRKNMLY
ncbi:ankyrin repeat-containing protein At5g02620-like [Prosopis cineraria]|uniref:ankyrin repeat-containing protein At5g02620-like n=1 Tax=Prosopis cineraria TaxID=364024 RepID=UPI00240FAF5E|nr:ankyrin repeat-containing protein At5g02620-like [Prosopis cineraria]XP_054804409.1 ankyrin repeat-containing protein At5g02620-like [Prosopis cineraria]XP_054804431.1 ankyrin repeat-containing protein At5g02620-like [Prosopis cineraria]XP_054804432.1 ankyrin repeat-containing protein At5g02620-like [Prosopis cineraria]